MHDCLNFSDAIVHKDLIVSCSRSDPIPDCTAIRQEKTPLYHWIEDKMNRLKKASTQQPSIQLQFRNWNSFLLRNLIRCFDWAYQNPSIRINTKVDNGSIASSEASSKAWSSTMEIWTRSGNRHRGILNALSWSKEKNQFLHQISSSPAIKSVHPSPLRPITLKRILALTIKGDAVPDKSKTLATLLTRSTLENAESIMLLTIPSTFSVPSPVSGCVEAESDAAWSPLTSKTVLPCYAKFS